MQGDDNFKWYWIPEEDAEYYNGPFDTRRAALEDAYSKAADYEIKDSFFVFEAARSVVEADLIWDSLAETVIEELIERNDECWHEGDASMAWTREAEGELAEAIKSTVTGWLAKNPAKTFTCVDQRNFDEVSL